MGNSHSNNNEVCQLVVDGKTFVLSQRPNNNISRHKFSYFDLTSKQMKLMSGNPTQIKYQNKLDNSSLIFCISPNYFYRNDIEKFNHKIEKREYTDIIEGFEDSRLILRIRCNRDLYEPETLVIEYN